MTTTDAARLPDRRRRDRRAAVAASFTFDPSGNRNEVFSGGYRTGADFQPITWTMDQAARGINHTHREIDQDFLQVVT